MFLTFAENYQSGYLNTFAQEYKAGDEATTTCAGTSIGEFDQMMKDFGYKVTVIGADAINGRDYFSTVKLALTNSKEVFMYVNSPQLKHGEWYANWSGTHFMKIRSITPEKKTTWYGASTYTLNMWDYGAWRDYKGITQNNFNFFTYGIGTTNK